MMPGKNHLKRYREKRDFTKTPEPSGTAAQSEHWRYLIQKHAATRLHYDFRLELDGVLKSWAVTRGPSYDPADKRLAVEVEDHPVEYGSFEGIIPKGQYGGGTVMLWDTGTWEPIGDPRAGLKKGKLEFILHGQRLKGEWTLVRMRERPQDKGRHNWLLIKHHDKIAKTGKGEDWLKKQATSIVSKRSMEKIAAQGDRVWQSKKTPSPLQGEKFIPPQLATLTDAMPKGTGWVHEIKFDGYRGLAYLQNNKTRIFTRNGLDWTEKFRAVADALKKLPVKSAIFDGEIVALKDGVSSFMALKDALGENQSDALQYYVFDLLYLNGRDLRSLPLLTRKETLEKLIPKKSLGGRIFYSEHFTAGDEAILKRLCGMRLEGAVSKRSDAPYTSGRGKTWLKTKCSKRQEFVIGGFTQPTHAERGIGALLLGYYEEEEFKYAGKVGTGFGHDASLELRKRLDKLTQKTPAFKSVPADGRRGATWVKPRLVCEVEFTEWTSDGRLRHPSFQGLREDKSADTVEREYPSPHRREAGRGTVSAPPERNRSHPVPPPKGEGTKVSKITITHPDRLLYPGTDITKVELAEYYYSVADYILPHIKNRPLSMVRCPEGTDEPCFFQRHIARGQSPYLHEVPVRVKDRTEHYLAIRDVEGLVTLTQWGVIELHMWGCLADKPELPDRIIFDLDPDPDVAWKDVLAATREVRARMQEFGLQSFVKTTGGKGLHVTIPLARHHGWPTIKAFAHAVALSMAHDHPEQYIAKSSKAARKGKIFVDYLRNDLTSTAIAPFSARARKGAPVAMTLDWADLKPSLRPDAFTIRTSLKHLQKRKTDPWEEFFMLRQKIPAKVLKALGIEN